MDSIFNIEVLTQNIIELCEKENVSVNRMLKECGLSKSVIGNLKKGYEPQLGKIVIIADYFGVTVDYLINNSPVGSGKESKYRKLDKQQREDILTLIKNKSPVGTGNKNNL